MNTQTINQLKSLIVYLQLQDKDFTDDIDALNKAIEQLTKLDNARNVLLDLTISSYE